MDEKIRRIGLALSGGNALGAYAAGAYEAVHEAGYPLDLVTGASIGAVTAAIIAGNPPPQRVEQLQAFWQQAAVGSAFGLVPSDGRPRDIYNKMHALQSLLLGRPGLFMPRPTGFMSMLPGTPPDLGIFDSAPLVQTLQRLVDFDYLNQAHLPLVITSVDLETGEPVFFDSRQQKIEPLHLLASTAFIPAFPPVEVDGRCLGDSGMFCNLPLDPLLAVPPAGDQLCIAVDLYEARGPRPMSMDSALERAQDIAFSSQSRRTIEAYRKEYRLRALLARAENSIDGAPGASTDPVHADTAPDARTGETELVLVAYRPPVHETGSKAMEFSRASIAERWASGKADMGAALDMLREGRATTRDPGFVFYDGRRDG